MSEARDQWGESLPRRVGLGAAVAVLVGTTIGSGIFRVPAGIAGTLGDPGPVMLAWTLGGVLALFGALTIAELAAAFPRSGGIFTFLYEGLGPMPAFLFGWSQIVVIRASALGAIATIFAEYLGHFVPLEPMQVRYVAATAIVTVTLFNYVGVRKAAVVQNLTTVAKYAALALLVVLAFSVGDGSYDNFRAPVEGRVFEWSLLATALISVMWTYDGWADVSYMGGEIKDPGKTLPRALILGTLAIIAIYLSVNLAYIYLVPLPEMAGEPLVASAAALKIPLLGAAGASIVALVVMISTFGSLNGTMMASPRIFFAMAERRLIFPALARVSPRFQSPSGAIFLAMGLGVLYVLLNDFQALADRFILGIWPFYIMAVAVVFVLRKKRPDLPRPYRTLGYPVIPAIFMLASIGMVINALVTDPVNTGITFAIILAGIPVYWIRGVWMKKP